MIAAASAIQKSNKKHDDDCFSNDDDVDDEDMYRNDSNSDDNENYSSNEEDSDEIKSVKNDWAYLSPSSKEEELIGEVVCWMLQGTAQ